MLDTKFSEETFLTVLDWGLPVILVGFGYVVGKRQGKRAGKLETLVKTKKLLIDVLNEKMDDEKED